MGPDQESESGERSSAASRSSSFSSMAEAIMPQVHTTKEIWRKPRLHRDTAIPSADLDTRYNSHRAETWYELFYDLVFVAGSIQISNFMKYDISIWGLFKSGIIFAVLRSTWDQLMFYQNKFDTKDVVHHIYYLVQAMCAFMMALHLSTEHHGWDQEEDLKSFALAAVVSRMVHCIMYLQVIVMTKKYRSQFIILIFSQIVASMLFAVSSVYSVDNESYVWLWLAAIIVERTLTFVVVHFAVPKKHHAPPHFGHLSHRQSNFILLILGEAIIVLVQSNTTRNHDINYFLRGLMGFGLVFNVGDVYYQQQVVGRLAFSESPKSKPVALWTALHLLLSISILFFAVGLKLVFNAESADGRMQKYEYLLCWATSATLMLIFFIRMTHKGVSYKGKRVRWLSYGFRFGISCLCNVVPLVSSEAMATIGTLFFFSTLLVLQDLFSHRGVREDSLHAEPSSGQDSCALRETCDTGDSYRIARVDNGLSSTTMQSDSFFFRDESFGRDKYLLERRPSQQQAGVSSASDELCNPLVAGGGEKSRFFAGGRDSRDDLPRVREPLLGFPSSP